MSVPAVGLGTWGEHTTPDEMAEAVRISLKVGYRHVDCAEYYGNQTEIGAALAQEFELGTVKREDVFVTSKVWNTNHDPVHVREACVKTLLELRQSYLDLYLVHWPLAWKYTGPVTNPHEAVPLDGDGAPIMAPVPLHETWRAMESLVDDGLVKRIGVSNFCSQTLNDLLSYARIKTNLVKLCGQHGIVVVAYTPLGRPGTTTDKPALLLDPTIQRIAGELRAEPAQVVLAWALQRGVCVVPKSSTEAHLTQRTNLQARDLQLSDKQFGDINAISERVRYCDYDLLHGCRVWD